MSETDRTILPLPRIGGSPKRAADSPPRETPVNPPSRRNRTFRMSTGGRPPRKPPVIEAPSPQKLRRYPRMSTGGRPPHQSTIVKDKSGDSSEKSSDEDIVSAAEVMLALSSNDTQKQEDTDLQPAAAPADEGTLKRRLEVMQRSIIKVNAWRGCTAIAECMHAIEEREANLKQQRDAIDEEKESLERREQALRDRQLDWTMQIIEETIRKLELDFCCNVCKEVAAHPTTLTVERCGHNFCALCILKWFFSGMSWDWDAWMASLICPICRNPVPFFSEIVPRPMSSFPFALNARQDREIVQNIEFIELSGGTAAYGARKGQGKRAKISIDDKIASWCAGGYAREDWSRRDKIGRNAMAELVKDWCDMTVTDFENMKKIMSSTLLEETWMH